MSCSMRRRILFHQQTLPGIIYQLVRSASLTVPPKSWTQINLPACTDFQPPETLCKIISISLLDAAVEQGLAGQNLPLHSMPACQDHEVRIKHQLSPPPSLVMPPSASGHRPPCNLNLQLPALLFFSKDNTFFSCMYKPFMHLKACHIPSSFFPP